MNTVTAVTPVEFVVAPSLSFSLTGRPYNRVRVLGHSQVVTVHLPILDLDLTTGEHAAEITQRLRSSYRTVGEHFDEETNEVTRYWAGRQTVARAMEAAHDLMVKGGTVMQVWQGMDESIAAAIEKAILNWRPAPVVPASTGSARGSFDRPEYQDPDLDAVAVEVTRFFLNGQGIINPSFEPKYAVYDRERELLYFDDYVTDANRMLDGFVVQGTVDEHGEFGKDKLVAHSHLACNIDRELPIKIGRTGSLTYNADISDFGAHGCGLVPIEAITQLRYAVMLWRDAQIEQHKLNDSPTRRQYNFAARIAKFDTDELAQAEIASGFDDLFDGQRLPAIREIERLEYVKRKPAEEQVDELVAKWEAILSNYRPESLDALDFIDPRQGKVDDGTLPFDRWVNEVGDMRLHAGKIRPVLKYNANKPGEWQMSPKAADAPRLVSIIVKDGIAKYNWREKQLAAERTPIGTITVCTPYDRRAHDGTAKTIYVGKGWNLQEGSLLANGPLNDEQQYREWLFNCIKHQSPAFFALQEIVDHIRTGSWLRLVAWPLTKKGENGRGLPVPAYVEVIASAARYLAAQPA